MVKLSNNLLLSNHIRHDNFFIIFRRQHHRPNQAYFMAVTLLAIFKADYDRFIAPVADIKTACGNKFLNIIFIVERVARKDKQAIVEKHFVVLAFIIGQKDIYDVIDSPVVNRIFIDHSTFNPMIFTA